jgi:hypothetical protein
MPKKGREDRDWRRYERDWKGYERYRRDEVNLYLTRAKSIVESNPAPWTPQKRGQPPYPPKAMVALLLLKTRLGMDYRSVSAYLHAFPEQRSRIGLEKTPSHTPMKRVRIGFSFALPPRQRYDAMADAFLSFDR